MYAGFDRVVIEAIAFSGNLGAGCQGFVSWINLYANKSNAL
jgi:hypothetical protein